MLESSWRWWQLQQWQQQQRQYQRWQRQWLWQQKRQWWRRLQWQWWQRWQQQRWAQTTINYKWQRRNGNYKSNNNQLKVAAKEVAATVMAVATARQHQRWKPIRKRQDILFLHHSWFSNYSGAVGGAILWGAFFSETSLQKTLASETKVARLITWVSARNCTLKLQNSDFWFPQ